MQLIQLHYFCTVARFGNMRRAADELWISQSALSKSISSLEEELDVRLFDRVGRNIYLNEVGKLYYEKISEIIVSFNNINKEVRDLHNKTANTVSLLMSSSNFISDWIWSEFNSAHPDINLFVNSYYSVTNYDIMQSDFHIFATPYEDEGVNKIKLFDEELLIAMGKNHVLANEKELKLKQLKDYYFQTLPPNENLRINLISYCDKAGFQPKIAYSTEDSFSFFNVLASGKFLTLLPEKTIRSTLKEGIVLKSISDFKVYRSVYLSWDKNRYASENAKIFLEFCQQVFEEKK